MYENVMKELGTLIAEKQDAEIKEHLTRLFLDPHFRKWFKKHYDFTYYVIPPKLTQDSVDDSTRITVSHQYSFSGPYWIPWQKRLARKLHDLIYRLRWGFRWT